MGTATLERPPAKTGEALALPKVDGQAIDRIEVALGGTVRLDRSDPADVALMRSLMLGKEVTLRVVCVVAAKPARIVHDEDGYPGEVTLAAKLKATSLYRPVADGTEARTGTAQLDIDGAQENES